MNHTENLCRTIKRMCNNVNRDYTYLDYIRTPISGTSVLYRPYLIIDYYPNEKTEYDISMSYRIWESNKSLFGVFNNRNYITECQNVSTEHGIRFYYGSGSNYSYISFAQDNPNLKLTTNNGVVINNGVSYTYHKPTVSSTEKVHIFTCFTTATVGVEAFVSAATFNYITIYENGIKVIELIPALRNRDNVAGAYDKIHHKFYTNAGTGYFEAGNPLPWT